MSIIGSFYSPETGHTPLSNFSLHFIQLDGLRWATVEHYYQAMKTTNPEARESIRQADSPGMAKRMGRHVPLREDWEAIKILVMRRALRAKFHIDSFPGQYLLDTGDALLVEGNDWGDRFWGVDSLRGENWLGHLLMARRAELRSMADEALERLW